MTLPSVEELRSALDYNRDTGLFTWKYRENASKCWNSRWAGKPAGSKVSRKGSQVLPYLIVTIELNGMRLRAHRVAWAMVHGTWPSGEIDHINGNPLDNRIENLRDVSRQENSKNQQRRSNNKSGVPGVGFDKQTNSWYASIMIDGKHIKLGRFKSFLEAVRARQEALIRYGFHANHGRGQTFSNQLSSDAML
jgi:hypothetical protein